MRKELANVILCIIVSMCIVFNVFADDISSAREIIKKNGNAVIKISLVLKRNDRGEKREYMIEVVGTIISNTGLAVICSDYMSDSATQIVSAAYLMTDGSRISAKVVLRDKDLLLALLHPVDKPSKPLSYVDITNPAKPDLLDTTITISRHQQILNRSLCALMSKITTVVDKPRKMYVAEYVEPGAPAFLLNGQVVGIGTYKKPLNSEDYDEGIPIILPAEEIKELASQIQEFTETSSQKEPEKKTQTTQKKELKNKPSGATNDKKSK